jgi:N-acetylneuraminic acid mutarotase
MDQEESIETLEATVSGTTCSFASAAVDNKVYLFGGRTASGDRRNQIKYFDVETQTFTTLSVSLPTAAMSGSAVAVGTRIYIFGGWTSSSYLSTILRFDTETETLTTLGATLYTVACSLGCALAGSKIYIFGGRSSSNQSTIQVFDTATESITRLNTTLSVASYSMGCATVGTKIYLVGGYPESSCRKIDVFDTETNEIEKVASLYPGIYDSACVAVGNIVYWIGGTSGSTSNAVTNTICSFDTKTGEIVTLPVTTGKYAYQRGYALVGTKVYLIGGYGVTAVECFSAKIFKYLVEAGVVHIIPSVSGNLFPFINTDTVKAEIGVDSVLKGNTEGIGEEVEAALYKDGAWVTI